MNRKFRFLAILMMLLAAFVFTGCDGNAADGLFDGDDGGDGPTPPPAPAACTVSFAAGEGTGSMEPVTVEKGASYKVPACTFTAPAGKEFKCWNDGTADINVGETIVVNNNITLTAQWQDQDPLAPGKYRVIFDVQGHGTAPAYQDIDLGDKVTAPTAPTAAGYTFDGWYKESECLNAWNFGSDTSNVEKAITLYAKWVYEVSFVANGGSGNMDSVEMNVGDSYTAPASTFTAPSFTAKTGAVPATHKNFAGWNTKADGTGTAYAVNAEIPKANITLYAQWSKPSFTVGVDSEGTAMKVYFAKGNMWADGSNALHFESNQYSSASSWDASHVSHFTWSSTVADAVGNSNSGDNLFCDEDHKVSVDGGEAIYYALTSAEWSYLLNTRANASNLKKYGVTVCTKPNCLIIAPDNFSGTIETSYDAEAWAAAEAAGLVCLPAAGYRVGSFVYSVGGYGDYWSSTPDEDDPDSAYRLYFDDSYVVPAVSNDCDGGFSVRLVVDEN